MNLEQQTSPLPADGLLAEAEATPHPRLRLHRAFPSRYLPGQRDLIVYLPPGYDQHPERSYPVLYLQDGQNLFDGKTSFIQGSTWQVREQADAAIEAGEVEPLVIVGIYNTGDRRMAEYTHERDWKMGGGEAEDYGLMLTRELMPWIAGQYRVRTERESTGAGRLFPGRSGDALSGSAPRRILRQTGVALAQRLVEPQEHSRLPERARPPDMGAAPAVARRGRPRRATAPCSTQRS